MATIAPTLALRHFDSYYLKVFGRTWPSIRLGLLSPKNYYFQHLREYNNSIEQASLPPPKEQISRKIGWEKLSNKKITRLEADIELGDGEFKGRLINRNPRNLEQSFIEHKPKGFWLDKSAPMSWNTLVFEQCGEHLVANLKSWYGKQLISVSTKEPQLSKYFKNPNTRQAAILLGKIMSRRCLQSGYLYAGIEGSVEDQAPKTKAFYESVMTEGFVLEEPREIEPRSNTDI